MKFFVVFLLDQKFVKAVAVCSVENSAKAYGRL